MQLIDAEELKKEIGIFINIAQTYHENRAYKAVLHRIDVAPTIEAKPIVYCKDCKYNVANSERDPLDITDYTDITCEYFMTDGMSPNDYCSKGVKIPVISMEDVPELAKELENESWTY